MTFLSTLSPKPGHSFYGQRIVHATVRIERVIFPSGNEVDAAIAKAINQLAANARRALLADGIRIEPEVYDVKISVLDDFVCAMGTLCLTSGTSPNLCPIGNV